MKIAYSTICINPNGPFKQAGFLLQVNPIYNFHDDLHARIIAFEDDEKILYHLSCDTLGWPINVQEAIEEQAQKLTDKKVYVTVSATHTHFGANVRDIRYQGEFVEKVLHAIPYLQFEEYDDVAVSYQCVPFEKVGTSRISNHKANVLLQLFTIYANKKPLLQMMVHNCHPTIHSGTTPYFTSEYPGYVISELNRKYPDMYFTFMQGAAGDVSTRFTRPSQDYAAVRALGDEMVKEVERLMANEVEVVPFDKIVYASEVLPLEHEFNPIDLSNIPANLTPRELETIQQGVIMRENLSKKLENLVKQVKLSKMDFGPYTIVFCPNEAFSSYIDCVDTKRSALAAYSNGYSPYLTGVADNFITYEKFTDTVTVDAKNKYMDILRKFGK